MADRNDILERLDAHMERGNELMDRVLDRMDRLEPPPAAP
jgi:hypothetical protein